MTTYHTPTSRQIQDWNVNACLPADQPAATMKLELPLPANISFEAVEDAYRLLLSRHAILRTCFPLMDGQIVQQVVDYDPVTFGLLRLDAGDANVGVRYQEALAKMKDLTKPPLVKSAVWYGAAGAPGGIFILLIQHILCDAWSMKLLRAEIEGSWASAVCSAALPVSLPATDEDQLVGYIERNRSRLEKTQAKNLSHWRNELTGKVWRTDFNAIYRNSLGAEAGAAKIKKFAGWENLKQEHLFRNPRGQFYTVCMEEPLFKKLAGYCACNKLSLHSVLAGCWALLGMEMAGNSHVLIRSIYHNRVDGNVKKIVGNLLGDTFLYLRVDGRRSFLEFCVYCYRQFFQSIGSAVFSMEGLEELQALTHCLMLFNFLSKEVKGGAGRMEGWEAHTTESNQIWSPFFVDAEEFSNTISFNCGYHVAYMDAEVVGKLFRRYFDLLHRALDNPLAEIKQLQSI